MSQLKWLEREGEGEGGREKEREIETENSPFLHLFCSNQALKALDDVHLHWEGKSALFRLLI